MKDQKMPASHSTVIANRFLDLGIANDQIIQQMRLQKLVFFAHGWHLAIYDSEFTTDKPEAWELGPIYVSLFVATSIYGCQPIKDRLLPAGEDRINATQDSLIKRVFEVYRGLNEFELVAQTHKRNSPWHQVYSKHGEKRCVIPPRSIKEHFFAIGQEGNPAHA